VIPLAATGRLHFLVLFSEPQSTDGHAAPRLVQSPRTVPRREQKSRVEFLQRELAASREYLQSIIQELEAANEELQSANEEILSSNEELQSTNEELDTAKEELQSTNEELNTVNDELHGRNEEMTRVNSDLVNLLASVQIAILIVSADLRIRRFTPMAEKVLNLIPTDTDRFIGHINPNIVGANLEQLISECIENIAPIEREVQDRQGHWYSLRIRPYRSVDNRIDGAVLALFDIDAPKRFEESVRAAVGLLEGTIQEAARPMGVVDGELRLRVANVALLDLLRAPAARWHRMTLPELGVNGAGMDGLRELAAGASPGPSEAMDLQVQPAGAGGLIHLRARSLPAYDAPQRRVILITAAESPAPAAPPQ
jgi:two-component system CheB/CheR fusion protein